MPKFKFKIKEESGFKEDIEQSSDKYTLMRKLKNEGKNVVSIEEIKSSGTTVESINRFLSKVKLQDKIVFSRNLSAMIEAGLPIARALGILKRQTKNIKFKYIIGQLLELINKGGSLSDGMSKFPKVFPPLFISMVHAGEESGSLTESLNVISNQLEKSYTLKKKIKGAMLYPAIVLSIMFIIGILMFIYVVPTLTSTFKGLGAQLPATTRFVIFLSDFLSQHTFLALSSIVVFISSFMFMLRTKKGTRVSEFIILRTPVIGKISKQANSARTARTLSSLLSAGVDMVEAISITKNVVQNSYYKEVLEKAKIDVQKGLPLSGVFMEREDLYPILVGEMMEVGEETGKFSEMLLRVAIFFEDEVDAATKNISTIVEPVLMVIIGIGVGFFALAMITPMYSLSSAI